MGRRTVSLHSRKAGRESLSGGKGAGLARLIRGGFPVPPGFIIPASVFRRLLTQASHTLDLHSTIPSPGDLERLRHAFQSMRLPARTEKAVLDKLHLLGRLAILTKQLDMALANDDVTAWHTQDISTKLGIAGRDGDRK